MGKRGVELAGRYAYGSCQKASELKIYQLLLDLLQFKNSDTERKLRQQLKELKPYNHYLKISQNWQIEDPFAYEVVRAYWLGNELLEDFIPIEMPHHNLVILKEAEIFSRHFGWLNILRNLNYCKVSIGKVKNIFDDHLLIETKQLFLNDGRLEFKRQNLLIKKGLLKKIKKNCLITFHWQEAREIIQPAETYHLQWVDQILFDYLNRSLSKEEL